MRYNSTKLQTTNGLSSHFCLHEFSNSEGVAMVPQETTNAIEALRFDLNEYYEGGVKIRITDATRTESDNEALAKKLGWTDSGGKVSKNSQHLTRNGATALDIIPYHSDRDGKPSVNLKVAEELAKKSFKFVKIYDDGHLHVDLVDRRKKDDN